MTIPHNVRAAAKEGYRFTMRTGKRTLRVGPFTVTYLSDSKFMYVEKGNDIWRVEIKDSWL